MHGTPSDLSEKLSQAAQKVAVGAKYIHYKNKDQTYKVLHIALTEETSEPCVIYQAEYGDKLIWARPLRSWLGEVDVDGKKVRRFTRISEEQA